MERRAFFKLAGLSAVALAAGGVLGACSSEQLGGALAPVAGAGASDAGISVAGQPAISFSTSVDVLVVGSGVSGLSAAIAPLKAGRSVMIADKLDLLGGESYNSNGVMRVAGSDLQAQAGFSSAADDAWAARKKELGDAGASDLDFAKTLFLAAPNWVDLLSEEFGAQFADPKTYASAGINEAIVLPKNGIGGMEGIMVPLRDGLSSLGATFATGHRAAAFILAEDGTVCGMRFYAQEAQAVVDVRARCVAIATGGFSSSQTLVGKYTPDWQQAGCCTNASMGEGQLLCAAIGGQLSGMDKAAPLIGDVPQAAAWGLFGPTVVVDALGKRFAREDSENAAATACFSDVRGYWWTIFDHQLIESSQSRSIAQVTSKYTKRIIGPFDDVSALAVGMGVSSDALDDTFSRYAGFVDAQRDADFGRLRYLDKLEGPYYALKQRPVRYRTRGGVKTDDAGRVLGATGLVIPHVYCCGSASVGGGEGLASNGASGMLTGNALAAALSEG